MKLLSGECHRTPLMISQHWFRLWQQAITWASIDPIICRHMASLCHKKLIILGTWDFESQFMARLLTSCNQCRPTVAYWTFNCTKRHLKLNFCKIYIWKCMQFVELLRTNPWVIKTTVAHFPPAKALIVPHSVYRDLKGPWLGLRPG